ncbi:DUF1770-domain-containing protein [Westerdykella ornata]|uniref:DUF1770-domain-containing protein n=1 Tax=Westerdykella ornata TaxID=318751 RepID=A0A6A6J8A1_WESOR|nr:DUF1770-domain-containing protein [Westerdykella ornata]KAF2271866.1 DUF1770-domain-containing protein [Westerdykella ornata]
MAADAPIEIASLLQSASIKRNPSPAHDLNPSTAASEKQPVRLSPHADLDDVHDAAEDEIPISLLDPIHRRTTMPPLPDMRFEQSYLKSIEKAGSWQGVLWITLRDQVVMCFMQGVLWNLLVHGWRYFNRSSKFSGRSIGARLRRWWWGVNKWSIPSEKGYGSAARTLARNATGVCIAFLNVRTPRNTLGARGTVLTELLAL